MSTSFQADLQSASVDFGGVEPVDQTIVNGLRATFTNLSSWQQAQLCEIQPLATTDADSFKARMAKLRQDTIDKTNAAINQTFDDLKKAGERNPAQQPLIAQAMQQVVQLGQGFVAAASSAYDAVDHAGALVVDSLGEAGKTVAEGVTTGAEKVGEAVVTAGGAIVTAGETVAKGIESVFSGW